MRDVVENGITLDPSKLHVFTLEDYVNDFISQYDTLHSIPVRFLDVDYIVEVMMKEDADEHAIRVFHHEHKNGFNIVSEILEWDRDKGYIDVHSYYNAGGMKSYRVVDDRNTFVVKYDN